MHRVVNAVQVAFWASVTLLAVYLAVTPRDGRLGLLGVVLWCVVMVSSAFLTARLAVPTPSREEDVEFPEPGGARFPGRASEWLAYPIVFCLALYVFSSQGVYY